MASRANYLIASSSSSGAVFSFDRSASSLKECKDSDFKFDIVPTDDGNEQAVFQIWKDGALMRENKSTPFPPGALTKKSCKVKKENCLVEVKNPGGLDLDSLFP